MSIRRLKLSGIYAAAIAGACLLFTPTAFAADGDGDLVDDAVDNCVGVANAEQLDGDADGKGDACDGDYNNDGVVNGTDFALLEDWFNTENGDGVYYSDFDHNSDGVIDGLDVDYFTTRLVTGS